MGRSGRTAFQLVSLIAFNVITITVIVFMATLLVMLSWTLFPRTKLQPRERDEFQISKGPHSVLPIIQVDTPKSGSPNKSKRVCQHQGLSRNPIHQMAGFPPFPFPCAKPVKPALRLARSSKLGSWCTTWWSQGSATVSMATAPTAERRPGSRRHRRPAVARSCLRCCDALWWRRIRRMG